MKRKQISYNIRSKHLINKYKFERVTLSYDGEVSKQPNYIKYKDIINLLLSNFMFNVCKEIYQSNFNVE